MRSPYLIYCLSGFVSLGYQVAWFRIFVDRFGSTNLTFSLVLSNFIAGLGIGALASRRVSQRIGRLLRRDDALFVYGVIEILVGLTAALTLLAARFPPDLFGSFSYQLVEAIHQPSALFAGSQLLVSLLCVFLPCFFMGVTFPLLCRAYGERPRFPSALYGWNTLGACSGILACEFILLPRIGHGSTYAAMVVTNIALGLYVVFGRIGNPAEDDCSDAVVNGEADSQSPGGTAIWTMSTALACAIIAGLLTGAFEADVLRRLQFLDCRTDAAMSCISFWAILAIFAASFTVRGLPGMKPVHIKFAWAIAFFLYLGLCHSAYGLRDWVHATDIEQVIATLPPDTTGLGVPYPIHYFRYSSIGVFTFTGIFVFPAFFLMSLLLPQICNAVQGRKRHLGLVYGANTVAFCVGISSFTLLAPRVNVFYSLKLFPSIFAILVLAFLLTSPQRPLGRWRPGLAVLLIAIAALVTPTSFEPNYLPADSPAAAFPVRAMRSNGTHTTYVVADPVGDFLYFDSHTMSGCNMPAQKYMRLMAHFPLLAHAEPKSALLICFGVGNTASAIAAHETIEVIDVVDLNDQVLATAPEFARYNHDVIDDPRLNLFHDDGRRFLQLTDRRYDLITSEPPPPMFAGMYRLYSREYYESAREHLTPGGLMTQWLPIDQMPLEAMAESIATFISIFPESIIFVGSDTNYIIMGSREPIDLALVEKRFPQARGALRDLQAFGIISPLHLLARIVQGPKTLQEVSGKASIISDQGIGFGHLFIDPEHPALIRYDPIQMLEEVQTERLECGSDLRRNLTHLGRLKFLVDDFPISALQSIPENRRPEVAMVDVDWQAVARFIEVAEAETRVGEFGKASGLLAEASNRNAQQLPHVLQKLADVLSLAGKFEASLEAWRLIVDLAPRNAAAHFRLAEVLVRLDRSEESLASYRRAIELDVAGIALLRAALGRALLALGRRPAALEAFEEALALDPDDAAALDGRRICLGKRN